MYCRTSESDSALLQCDEQTGVGSCMLISARHGLLARRREHWAHHQLLSLVQRMHQRISEARQPPLVRPSSARQGSTLPGRSS